MKKIGVNVPCRVEGCLGEWKIVFGVLDLGDGDSLPIGKITCTIGGDEHLKPFTKLDNPDEARA